jgi:glycine dehydrogenase subunit 1
VTNQSIEIAELDWQSETGVTDTSQLGSAAGEDAYAALVIPYPNFFGCLDDVDVLTDWAHERDMLVIAVVNPMALGLLKPPGTWGVKGADIVVGEGQPMGIPMSSGGPYLGFMCCSQAIVRQMPGRIVGRTVDLDGHDGFALTLQAREQHIRRAKATSNICTNQGLLVTAATIYMSLMGDEGLRSVASQCHHGLVTTLASLEQIAGVSRRFSSAAFHEAVVELPVPAAGVIARMTAEGILPGYDLGQVNEQLQNCLLVCVTETKTTADLGRFADELGEALG